MFPPDEIKIARAGDKEMAFIYQGVVKKASQKAVGYRFFQRQLPHQKEPFKRTQKHEEPLQI
jgi:hypothetical protein